MSLGYLNNFTQISGGIPLVVHHSNGVICGHNAYITSKHDKECCMLFLLGWCPLAAPWCRECCMLGWCPLAVPWCRECCMLGWCPLAAP